MKRMQKKLLTETTTLMTKFSRIAQYLMLLMVPAFQACTDDSYRGYEKRYDGYEVDQEIQVAVGDPHSLGTKGNGPVDALSDFAPGKKIFVWAYNRRSETSFSSARTLQDSLACLIDGYAALLDGENAIASWENDKKFWYPKGEKCAERFDFFAAFLDDAPFSVDKSNTRVRVSLNIDGSQDIMYSRAAMPQGIDGVEKSYAYSYLSSMDADMPIFTMEHALVRIDLVLKPGLTKDYVSNVRINSAKLNARTHVMLTVADKDLSNLGASFDENGSREDLLLTEAGGRPLEPIILKTLLWDGKADPEDFAPQQKLDTLGASFFVSPDTHYDLTLNMDTFFNGAEYGHNRDITTGVELLSKQPFLCGHRYRVVMTIYGEYAILSEVSMVDWENGGSFVVNKDEDDFIAIHLLDKESHTEIPQPLELSVGQTYPAQIVTLPEGQRVSVSSSSEAVASVSMDGDDIAITARAPGDAKIIITAPSIKRRPDGGYKVVHVHVK